MSGQGRVSGYFSEGKGRPQSKPYFSPANQRLKLPRVCRVGHSLGVLQRGQSAFRIDHFLEAELGRSEVRDRNCSLVLPPSLVPSDGGPQWP